MDLSLVNAGLAAGAGLAALPVILHLFMRPKPKQIVFPALRLIRERQKRTRKRLRVKNWLLLLARMAVLALMALALARPTLFAERIIGASAPAAMAFVFDTSLSMGLTQQDKSRLDEAKEQAIELISKSPASSIFYVVDSAEPNLPTPFSADLARKRIDSLSLRAANRTLNAAVGQAYSALAEAEKPRHEVYVFTDLARSAWDMDRPVEGLDKIAKVKSGIKTFVLRLTPREITNVAVVEAQPTSDIVTEGEPVEVRAKVRSYGPAVSRVAVLWLNGEPRDKKPVEIPANGEQEVRFVLPKASTSSPLYQGEVRLTGESDSLAFDDDRYFSFNVRPAINVLIVSDFAIDGEYLKDAIDPPSLGRTLGASRPYRAEWVPTSGFLARSENLSQRYRVIFLNNARDLDDAAWGRLSRYVQDGGGLVIGLGARSRRETYQSATALQLLPATVERVVDSDKKPTTLGAISDYSHPLFQRYAQQLDDVLAQVPVNRYWAVSIHEGSRPLISYADQAPALLERVFKGARTGRVLLWTTPLSRVAEVAGASGNSWNEFPNPLVGWSYFYLMRQSVAYLAGTESETLNFEAGDNVALPLDPTRRAKTYTVQDPPRKNHVTLSPPTESELLVVEAPQQLGNWEITGQRPDGVEERLGFSVNSPASESQFVPLETPDLDSLFGGKDKYLLADDPGKLGVAISKGRVGQELFPWIMMLILIVVCVESVLANRFYRDAPTRVGAAQPA